MNKNTKGPLLEMDDPPDRSYLSILDLSFKRRAEQIEGYTPVFTPENGLLRQLSVGRLRLDARKGAYIGRTKNRETVFHILVGQCTIEAHGPWGKMTFRHLGDRRDVFSGLPTAVILGPSTEYTVTPTTASLDIAVGSIPIEDEGEERVPAVIRPADVAVHRIGEGHYLRTVREVLGGESPALRLRLGETLNPVGRWSSWPHHDFDANPELAPEFEEVFLYFSKPGSGWGLQKRNGLFCTLDPVDDVLTVRNGDAAVMPLGDHPIVSGVDSQVLYVWFYVSPIPKVYARWAEDIGGYA